MRGSASAPLIQGQLVARIKDELVLAESASNLTREQRQASVLPGQLQENIVSAQGGSAAGRWQRRAPPDAHLREEAQDRLDRELIEFELRSKITPRGGAVAAGDWRYDRQIEKYQPPSSPAST